MATENNMYIANLDFLLNYGDGTTTDEIEYELYTVALQNPNTIHYDRQKGGGFNQIEQERQTQNVDLLMLLFGNNLIQSVYIVNEEKGFNPFIVVGSGDITTEIDRATNETLFTINYRLLDNIGVEGQIKMEI